MEGGDDATRALIEGDAEIEASFIELVVGASTCSEDEMEVADQLDALLASGRVRLRAEDDRKIRSAA